MGARKLSSYLGTVRVLEQGNAVFLLADLDVNVEVRLIVARAVDDGLGGVEHAVVLHVIEVVRDTVLAVMLLRLVGLALDSLRAYSLIDRLLGDLLRRFLEDRALALRSGFLSSLLRH